MDKLYKKLKRDILIDIPIITAELRQSHCAIKTALHYGAKFGYNMCYLIFMDQKDDTYVLEDQTFRYDGSVSTVISTKSWDEFVRALAVLSHGLLHCGLKNDYWKDNLKNYIKENMCNIDIVTSDYVKDEVR
ncbi:MAG: hypothetical protein ACRC92_26215 [Peptostreptococcaceae bacterium]